MTTSALDRFIQLEERLIALRTEAETLADATGELDRLRVSAELGEGVPAATLKAAQARADRAAAMPGTIAELERRLEEAADAWRQEQLAAMAPEADAREADDEAARSRVEKLREELQEAEADAIRAGAEARSFSNQRGDLQLLAGDRLLAACRRAAAPPVESTVEPEPVKAAPIPTVNTPRVVYRGNAFELRPTASY